MINDILRSAGSKTINKTEVVNVKLMNYLSRLTGILDRTPPRTIGELFKNKTFIKL